MFRNTESDNATGCLIFGGLSGIGSGMAATGLGASKTVAQVACATGCVAGPLLCLGLFATCDYVQKSMVNHEEDPLIVTHNNEQGTREQFEL